LYVGRLEICQWDASERFCLALGSPLMSIPLTQRARTTLDRLRRELLDQRNPQGHWIGQLSPSALSTATAISAMSSVLRLMPNQDPNRTKTSDFQR